MIRNSILAFIESYIMSKLRKNDEQMTFFMSIKQDILQHFDLMLDLDSFINISKDFFPSNLFHFLRRVFSFRNSTKVLVCSANFIMSSLYSEIWIHKCADMVKMKKSKGISANKKRYHDKIKSSPGLKLITKCSNF